MVYNILDYGAIPDGKTLSTTAIQNAIDECNKNGGGRVLIPTGNFYSGSIFLKDNVELHFEFGATLTASENMDDYNADDAYEQNYGCDHEEWRGKHLIMAIECDNVAITGYGIIDGSGESFRKEATPPHPAAYGWMYGTSRVKDLEVMRPGQLIVFVESTNIVVQGITIRNAPCWCVFVYGCAYVRIHGIQVFNHKTALNTDGIDIDSSRYVTISDCNIETGDDAITFRCATKRLKKFYPCEYVTVTNCNLAVSASAFRVGVGTGIIRHIRVSNITIERAGTGIHYMTSYRGFGEAKIEDVNFSDISINFCSIPVRFEGDRAYIKDATIENLRATHCIANMRFYPQTECSMSNITLRNIETYVKREERELTEENFERRGRHALHIIGVKKMLLDNVRVHIDEDAMPTWESKYLAENAEDITIRNCEL